MERVQERWQQLQHNRTKKGDPGGRDEGDRIYGAGFHDTGTAKSKIPKSESR